VFEEIGSGILDQRLQTTRWKGFFLALIGNYRIDMTTPACHPLSPVYRADVTLEDDIAEALPYVNATLDRAEFIPAVSVLVWREGAHGYALRARRISVGNVADRDEAEAAVRAIVERINSIWDRRGDIEPSYRSIEKPKLLDILKLLPRSNCGKCGYTACMAFADALSRGECDIEMCPPLLEEAFSEQLEALRNMGL